MCVLSVKFSNASLKKAFECIFRSEGLRMNEPVLDLIGEYLRLVTLFFF